MLSVQYLLHVAIADIVRAKRERVEEMVNDSLSAMRFCNLCVEDDVAAHSVLSRFRSALTQKKAFERLLKKVNRQLAAHKVILKRGTGVIDASITESPFSPSGRTTTSGIP
jgi:IS5 family transposase